MSPPHTKRYARAQAKLTAATTINDHYDSQLFRINRIVRSISGESHQRPFPAFVAEFAILLTKRCFCSLLYNLGTSFVYVRSFGGKIGIRVVDSKD
ncbi:hypothetical protein U1Q18_034024 [Sarracenia purpurea var. burkii]